MQEDQPDLIDIIENTLEEPDFDFLNYLKKGFEICTQFTIGFMLYTILYVIISELVGRIPTLGGIVNQLILSPVMLVGIYIVARRINKKEPYHFDQFWESFKFITPLMMVSLIQIAFVLMVLSPIFITGDLSLWIDWAEAWSTNPFTVTEFPGFRNWYLLLALPIIYFTITWIYAPLFVIFYNMQAWEAMETSRKIVSRNWKTFASFYLTIGIISISGVILFGVGLFFTIPLGACMLYASFEDIIEFYIGKDDDEDDLMKHLIDAF